MSSAAASNEPAETQEKKEERTKSALVLSWFYAQPKEIELVKRIYKKRGFGDVVVVESLVKDAATPRGWYKSFMRYVRGAATSTRPAAALNAQLARDFDVVHCMSGGFLNLYLLLAAGVPLRFRALVLDSTPILPQPRAFVRFARAYMLQNGLPLAPALLPEPVHTAIYTARWSLGALYVRIKHKWTRAARRLRDDQPAEVAVPADRWARSTAMDSVLNRYTKMSNQAIDTVLRGPPPTGTPSAAGPADKAGASVDNAVAGHPLATGAAEAAAAAAWTGSGSVGADGSGLAAAASRGGVIFLYNPTDPYLNARDVDNAVERCRGFGMPTLVVHNDQPHIQTIFRKPRILFDALSSMLDDGAAAPTAPAPEDSSAGS